MNDNGYMNGSASALWERTRQLNRAAWDAVGPAFGGACLFLFVSLPAAFFVGRGPLWLAVLSGATATGSFALAARYWWRWQRAISAVKEHSRRLKNETQRRGEGWANSR